MNSLNICWRGNAGTGKRQLLQVELKKLAESRKIPYTIQMKNINGNINEQVEDGEAEESGQIQYESSLLHIGFDIARMSMQDKQFLRPIFASLGKGSHVLVGENGHSARILVLYHAHLLSSESVILLQSCLEQNENDISIWMTSEFPVAQRIRDWFIEIPTTGIDNAYNKYISLSDGAVANWSKIFSDVFDKWITSPPPTIADVKQIKTFVYELLMRNYRWIEAVHCILDVVVSHPHLTHTQRFDCLEILAKCEATAAGYTIPSYRIPIIWEGLFVQMRNVLFRPVRILNERL
jgi:hypothetical protein